MELFVGLDVSQVLTHLCIVDQDGKPVWRGNRSGGFLRLDPRQPISADQETGLAIGVHRAEVHHALDQGAVSQQPPSYSAKVQLPAPQLGFARSASKEKHPNLSALDIEATERIDHCNHRGVVGPDASVDEVVTAGLMHAKECRGSRCRERDIDRRHRPVACEVGMMRRLEDSDVAVLAVCRWYAEPRDGITKDAIAKPSNKPSARASAMIPPVEVPAIMSKWPAKLRPLRWIPVAPGEPRRKSP